MIGFRMNSFLLFEEAFAFFKSLLEVGRNLLIFDPNDTNKVYWKESEVNLIIKFGSSNLSLYDDSFLKLDVNLQALFRKLKK